MAVYPEPFEHGYSRSLDILQEQAQKLNHIEEYNKMYPDKVKSICTISVSHGFHVDNLNYLFNVGGLKAFDDLSNQHKAKLIQ